MPTASRDILVSNKLGLHARPAMQFVDLANQFASRVTVKKGGEEPAEADGKSVMQMIILAATEGDADPDRGGRRRCRDGGVAVGGVV